MKVSRSVWFAVAVTLMWAADLPAQARVGGFGGSGGSVVAGGARGGAAARGGTRGMRGMSRGRSAGSITARGLPSVQGRRSAATGRRSAGRSRRAGRARGVVSSFPGTDRVVLNPPRTHGNVVAPGTPGRVSHGNVIAPGTPGRISHGNVITPGSPTISGTNLQFKNRRRFDHHAAHPKVFNFGHGHHLGIPIVYVPFGHTTYVHEEQYIEEEFLDEEELEEDSPYVVQVDPGARTRSSSEYVVEVDPDQGVEPPVSGRVFEVRPREPGGEAVEEPPAPEPDDTAEEAAAAEDDVLYLLALKNGAIYTSQEQWLQGDTLHYITRNGIHNLVTIDEVDLDLTARLNRERGILFTLEVREGRK